MIANEEEKEKEKEKEKEGPQKQNATRRRPWRTRPDSNIDIVPSQILNSQRTTHKVREGSCSQPAVKCWLACW